MDRSAYPIEIAIALLVLGGIVYVGKMTMHQPTLVREKPKMSSFETPKPKETHTSTPKNSGPKMKDDIGIPLD